MTQKVITVIKWEKKLKCSKLLFYESDEDLKKKKKKGEKKRKDSSFYLKSQRLFTAQLFSCPFNGQWFIGKGIFFQNLTALFSRTLLL